MDKVTRCVLIRISFNIVVSCMYVHVGIPEDGPKWTEIFGRC
jgi:hypothetical protein